MQSAVLCTRIANRVVLRGSRSGDSSTTQATTSATCYSCSATVQHMLAHSGSKCPEHAKNKNSISQVFSPRLRFKYFYFHELHALHIQKFTNSYSNKYDQTISRIFESYFWRVFDLCPNCVAVCARVRTL